jgi:hypothetical protein
MTLEETTKLLALIKLAYPNSYKDIDKDSLLATVNMWHRMFKDTPLGIIEMALDHFVKGSKFPPTIADITEELRTIYYEAMQNVLAYPKGPQGEVNRYIMQHTARYTERNDGAIHYGQIETLLKGKSQPQIGG